MCEDISNVSHITQSVLLIKYIGTRKYSFMALNEFNRMVCIEVRNIWEMCPHSNKYSFPLKVLPRQFATSYSIAVGFICAGQRIYRSIMNNNVTKRLYFRLLNPTTTRYWLSSLGIRSTLWQIGNGKNSPRLWWFALALLYSTTVLAIQLNDQELVTPKYQGLLKISQESFLELDCRRRYVLCNTAKGRWVSSTQNVAHTIKPSLSPCKFSITVQNLE